ncbi:hypothetical protein BH24ACT3_BH24ACT3_08310 [soil metagenome]
MNLWYPPKDRPHLFDWWRPIILASRAARLARLPWPIPVDELILVGRVDRRSRSAIWVYRHPESGGELYVDPTGQTHRFTRTPNATGFGRFSACDVRTAIWRAGLHDVVEPVAHREPHPRNADRGTANTDLVEAVQSAPKPRRRGHLTVHDGGSSLAG